MSVSSIENVNLDDVAPLAQRLSALDKVRLVELLIADLKQDLQTTTPPSSSAYGALADLGPAPSAEEIDEVRREMWAHVGEGDEYP
jgi:hypothetical protein